MLEVIGKEVIHCRACPRLVQWREQVGREKRRAFREWEYWARPIPGFGDPAARLLVLGLAPAAHGGNRTGRVFTGDRSADWLYAALYRAGFANQPTSTHRRDGLRLTDAFVTAAVKCAPPDNRPLPEERDRCLPFLQRELAALVNLRVLVALGGFAFAAALRALRAAGHPVPRPAPKFGHGVEVRTGPELTLIASYHPSQQNTFTGRLTEAMLDEVFTAARRALG
ncbi:MAG TPA: uracil-DNA glycosylase [Longimicrobiaceae bacterium]|nr:uracil-DNA glycosylase [Longimicrobiaceae bacterium]